LSSLKCINGLGQSYINKLHKMGIKTTLKLLEKGALPVKRIELAAKLGAKPSLILKWVVQCDFYRIKGMKPEYVGLMLAAGIATVNQIACFDTDSLHDRLAETNTKRNLVVKLPSGDQINNWIAQAEKLPVLLWFDGLYCLDMNSVEDD